MSSVSSPFVHKLVGCTLGFKRRAVADLIVARRAWVQANTSLHAANYAAALHHAVNICFPNASGQQRLAGHQRLVALASRFD